MSQRVSEMKESLFRERAEQNLFQGKERRRSIPMQSPTFGDRVYRLGRSVQGNGLRGIGLQWKKFLCINADHHAGLAHHHFAITLFTGLR